MTSIDEPHDLTFGINPNNIPSKVNEAPPAIGPQQSFYRKYIGGHLQATNQQSQSKTPDLSSTFSQMDPSIVIACLHNAITMHNREAGARSVCSPAHRWRQCQNHCTQILVARLLLFLSNYKQFRTRLSDRQQLKTIIQLLEPTLDPQLLCILLQVLALIALEPSTHNLFLEMQIDEVLIQMLLPADDWYYTNHSTKFGHFVKHHAARILVYIGMGDRVGNRVNLFQKIDSTMDAKKQATNSQNEDDYIYETCRTAHLVQENSKTAMSVEGILEKILQEVSEYKSNLLIEFQLSSNALSTTSEPITEESPSNVSPPTVQPNLTPDRPLHRCITEDFCDNAHMISDHGAVITITPSSGRPSAVGGAPVVIPLCHPFSNPTQRVLISLNNLETHLCKFSMIFDSMLILRVLLHKLSWDLSLVAKRRVPSADIHRTNNEIRAHSSCSLGSSFK